MSTQASLPSSSLRRSFDIPPYQRNDQQYHRAGFRNLLSSVHLESLKDTGASLKESFKDTSASLKESFRDTSASLAERFSLDMPRLDMSRLDMSKLEMPKLDMHRPNIGVRKVFQKHRKSVTVAEVSVDPLVSGTPYERLPASYDPPSVVDNDDEEELVPPSFMRRKISSSAPSSPVLQYTPPSTTTVNSGSNLSQTASYSSSPHAADPAALSPTKKDFDMNDNSFNLANDIFSQYEFSELPSGVRRGFVDQLTREEEKELRKQRGVLSSTSALASNVKVKFGSSTLKAMLDPVSSISPLLSLQPQTSSSAPLTTPSPSARRSEVSDTSTRFEFNIVSATPSSSFHSDFSPVPRRRGSANAVARDFSALEFAAHDNNGSSAITTTTSTTTTTTSTSIKKSSFRKPTRSERQNGTPTAVAPDPSSPVTGISNATRTGGDFPHKRTASNSSPNDMANFELPPPRRRGAGNTLARDPPPPIKVPTHTTSVSSRSKRSNSVPHVSRGQAQLSADASAVTTSVLDAPDSSRGQPYTIQPRVTTTTTTDPSVTPSHSARHVLPVPKSGNATSSSLHRPAASVSPLPMIIDDGPAVPSRSSSTRYTEDPILRRKLTNFFVQPRSAGPTEHDTDALEVSSTARVSKTSLASSSSIGSTVSDVSTAVSASSVSSDGKAPTTPTVATVTIIDTVATVTIVDTVDTVDTSTPESPVISALTPIFLPAISFSDTSLNDDNVLLVPPNPRYSSEGRLTRSIEPSFPSPTASRSSSSTSSRSRTPPPPQRPATPPTPTVPSASSLKTRSTQARSVSPSSVGSRRTSLSAETSTAVLPLPRTRHRSTASEPVNDVELHLADTVRAVLGTAIWEADTEVEKEDEDRERYERLMKFQQGKRRDSNIV